MIHAIFIGKNSCGYENGKAYLLYSQIRGNYLWIGGAAKNCQYVPYSSLESFLENWKLLNPTPFKKEK